MIALGTTIRTARSTDLSPILAIERASFSDPWSKESFETALSLQHMRFLVAESAQDLEPVGAGAALAGYVLALFLGEEGEVADIAVSPTVRRRGVGGALLDQLILIGRREGVRSLYLEVRESNVAARELYESRDFLPVGRRTGYYQSPHEDALVLKRDLGPG